MILAAGVGSRLMPLTLTIPKPMLQIANVPCLEHTINLCRRHNVSQIKMNLHYLPENVDKYFKDGSNFGVEISYSIEKKLLGTAGGIKRIQSFFDETFVVLSGDGFTNIDLSSMLEFHKANKSLATIAVKKFADVSKFGVVVLNADKSIKSFQEKPKKEEALSDLVNLGIYILEPEILEMIPAREEFDFGYNLFPELLKQSKPFYAYETDAYWSDIGSLDEYWKVNLDIADGKVLGYENKNPEVMKKMFVDSSSTIEKDVITRSTPPIIIGKKTVICKGADLRGPVIIGDECYIEENAIIGNTVVLNNTFIGKGIELKDSVVSRNYHMSIKNQFGTFIDDDRVLKANYFVSFKTKLNRFLINFTDRFVAFWALLFLSPIFTVVAIMIKFDSKGPIFYKSKRLKSPAIEKKGSRWYVYFKEKPVNYYVFRTMYIDADKRVKDLKNKYEGGPFVKIENDPRVTKVGNFLRKTSIDELPLLWNVLKGHMSLVGIWALPTYEAQHLLDKGMVTDEQEIDLTDVAQQRFHGKLGIAGFWQARGRSNLTAEERALHDTMQSVMTNISDSDVDYLGEYGEFKSYKGYLKMLFETFKSVVKREGAM